MALIELTVPDIGDVSDAAVIELLVKPGDTIRPEQSLITIESDKASMEVPAAVGGVLLGGPADHVVVSVTNAAGQVVQQVDLGARPAGDTDKG